MGSIPIARSKTSAVPPFAAWTLLSGAPPPRPFRGERGGDPEKPNPLHTQLVVFSFLES